MYYHDTIKGLKGFTITSGPDDQVINGEKGPRGYPGLKGENGELGDNGDIGNKGEIGYQVKLYRYRLLST